MGIEKIAQCAAHQGFHSLSNLAFKSLGAVNSAASSVPKILNNSVVDNAEKLITTPLSGAVEKQGDSFINTAINLTGNSKTKKLTPLEQKSAVFINSIAQFKDNVSNFLSKTLFKK